jgi:hypothetical protein
MASIFQKIRGTIETIFQFGLLGPQIKATGGNLEAKNTDDNGYVIFRGAHPVADNDFVTKLYADTGSTRYAVTAQFNPGAPNDPLPTNTGSAHFIVVTAAHNLSGIGCLLWDNGSGSGDVAVLTAADGRMIVTTQAFAGGTITFAAESVYLWDAGGNAWLNASGVATSAAVRTIRFPIAFAAATYLSATALPDNAVVLRSRLEITAPYAVANSITIGRSGSTTLLQNNQQNNCKAVGCYDILDTITWGGTSDPVLVSIAGALSAGAGFVEVEYTVPDA